MKCQVELCIAYVASVQDLAAFRKNSAMIFAAPTKFLPLSEYALEGHPRRETNRLKATGKATVSIVEKYTNKQTYPLVVVLPRPLKLLISNDPAKSRPVFVKLRRSYQEGRP